MAFEGKWAAIAASVIAILIGAGPSPVLAVSVKDILQEIIPPQSKTHRARPRPSAPRPPLPQPKPDAPSDAAEAIGAETPPLPPPAPAEKTDVPPPVPEADPRGPEVLPVPTPSPQPAEAPPPPPPAAPESPDVAKPVTEKPGTPEPATAEPPALSVGPVVEPTPPHVEETAPALPAAPGPAGALAPTVAPAPPAPPSPAAPAEPALAAPVQVEPGAEAEPTRVLPTPEELAACKSGMAALGIVSEVEPAFFEGECGAADPYRVTALSGGAVTIEPAATVDCAVASALARWVDEDIQPAAKSAYGAPLTRLSIAGSYVCRTRNHVPGARMSEHSFMNAIDIGGYTIAGRTITIADDGKRTDADETFLDAVRKAACARFTTVLGPGTDATHEDNLHLDMIRRGRNGDGRICE